MRCIWLAIFSPFMIYIRRRWQMTGLRLSYTPNEKRFLWYFNLIFLIEIHYQRFHVLIVEPVLVHTMLLLLFFFKRTVVSIVGCGLLFLRFTSHLSMRYQFSNFSSTFNDMQMFAVVLTLVCESTKSRKACEWAMNRAKQ